jgi:uncharacterized membrane protein
MAPVQQEHEGTMTGGAQTEHRESSFVRTLTHPVARVVFALPFFVFGINHFAMTGQMSGMVPAWIPGSTFWVYLTGVVLIAAAVGIMANRLIRTAGIVLAVMLLGFVATIHLPAMMAGGEGFAQAMNAFLKDTALAGGALMAAHFAVHRDRDDDVHHRDEETVRDR